MQKFFVAFLFAAVLTLPAYAEQRLLEDVIEEVNPSVVSIAVDVSDDEQALGAGIIISADGYVVSNAHVMENAKELPCRRRTAKVLPPNWSELMKKQTSLC